eukprot:473561-Rhodomonas_salina.1
MVPHHFLHEVEEIEFDPSARLHPSLVFQPTRSPIFWTVWWFFPSHLAGPRPDTLRTSYSASAANGPLGRQQGRCARSFPQLSVR